MKCTEVLWEWPKFDPMLVTLLEDTDDEEAKTNRVTKVMGQDKKRPIGSKKDNTGGTQRFTQL